MLLPDRTLVGRVGFHGPPDDAGRAELGYEIDEPFRRRGFAAEAVAALLEWGFAHDELKTAVASVPRSNEPSIRLLEKLGFAFAEDFLHEERGEQMRFERRA